MADFSLGGRTGNPVVLPVITEATAFTPTGSWVSNATYTGQYWTIGSRRKYYVKVALTGAPTAATLSINLPSGHTINSSLVDTTVGTNVFGQGQGTPAGNSSTFQVVSNGTTSVYVAYQGNTSAVQAVVNSTQPAVWANGNVIELTWDVPILELAGSANVAYGAGQATNLKGGLVTYENYVTRISPIAGATTTPNVTIKQSRVGKLVTIQLSATAGLTKNGANGPISVAIDPDFYPSTTISTENYGVINNISGVYAYAITAGAILMYGNAAGNNINAGQTNIGWDGVITFSYSVY